MRHVIALLLATGVCLAACSRQPDGEPAARATQDDWFTARDAEVEAYLRAHPAFAVVQGRHEYDGLLPDWSPAGIAAEIRRLHASRERLMAVQNLDDRSRFERDYFVARIDRDLFWLEDADAYASNPAIYLDWMLDNLDPSPYLTRNYALLPVRMAAYTRYARSVQRAAGQIRQSLRMPMARPLLERGVSAFRGFAEFFEKDVPGMFASVSDAALQKEFAEANGGAAKAMADLAAWLESQKASATADFALGPEKFARMVRMTEGVTTPIAALEAAGRADLERNRRALGEECGRFGAGTDIRGCIAKMNANKPRGGAVEGARAQLAGLKKFVQDAGVATIPGTEEALVDESPPYNRANSAYIDIPGPYEKGLPATYYISPPDPSWTAAEQRDYIPGQADLLFTSVHEVWPGHFLQFLHSNRNPSIVARLFIGYAFAEWWAHYAEEMMWEMGLGNGDPETHIGQLTNALLRNVRFLCALGLHTKGMTVAECEKMFVEQAFTDVGTARQQSTRGTYDPAYLNYTMGKLMIRKLREDWSASRGGKQAWRQFHDQFLTYGGPPIPMVRRQMMGNAEGPLF
jgi:hypothetical protein